MFLALEYGAMMAGIEQSLRTRHWVSLRILKLLQNLWYYSPLSWFIREKKEKQKQKNINKNKKQSQKQNQKQKLLNHDCRMYIILQDVMLQDFIIKAWAAAA